MTVERDAPRVNEQSEGDRTLPTEKPRGLLRPRTADEVTGEYDVVSPAQEVQAMAKQTIGRLHEATRRRTSPSESGTFRKLEPGEDPIDRQVAALEAQLETQMLATAQAEERARLLEADRSSLQGVVQQLRGAAESLLRQDAQSWVRENGLREQVTMLRSRMAELEPERRRFADGRKRENEAFEREMAMARQIIDSLEAQCARNESRLATLQSALQERAAEGHDLHVRNRLLTQQLVELGVVPQSPAAPAPAIARHPRRAPRKRA